MILRDKRFKLFSCCFPVKGATRSVICDVQRHTFDFVPNTLLEIVAIFEGKTIQDIITAYGEENEEAIKEYFTFLYEQEYIFFCDSEAELARFPKMSLEWDAPFQVTNAIIDIEDETIFDFENIVNQLETLSCPNVQFRVFKPISWEVMDNICQLFEKKSIKTIHLILPFDENLAFGTIEKTCSKYKRITLIEFFGAMTEKEENIGYCKVFYIKEIITGANHCGRISARYFVSNLNFFTESQHHNTCLNRKISIDKNGNIKNCPSMTESYGNIANITLQEALNHPDFKKYWNIKKDQISVCKDCEFRHICTDCRAYVENLEDIYSKPLKCGYNPYTCEWEDWSTNPLKEKAMKHYGLTEVSV
jgi:SPASM domain peptide maturase of grasp-with-spasm system